MFCYKCGAELNDSAVFCSSCGTRLKEETVNATSVEDAVPSEKEQKKLEETVAILYDMELNNYFIRTSIDKLNNDIANGNYSYECPECPQMEHIPDKVDRKFVPYITLLFGILISVVVGFRLSLFLYVGALISIISVVALIFPKSNKKRIEEAEKAHMRRISEYKWKVSQAEKRCVGYLTSQKDMLSNKLDQSQELLDSFYEKSGIDKAYCNIIAIGHMHEYIRLNITKKLDGHNGLYDRVRQDIRVDDIRYAIDNLSAKIDVLINHQKMLYAELKDINGKCDKIIGGLKNVASKISENTNALEKLNTTAELSAHWNERSAKEAQYKNIMDFYYRNV